MTTEAKWPLYSLKLETRSEVAERTLALRFDKPALIGKHLQSSASPGDQITGPLCHLAGPRAMVAGLRAMLNKAGVDDDDIRTEEFTGC
ncbi:hypothetical protein [Sorangium sp. So ce590]|uniref:hypothetical protein n=1 Tax=unclassified Sorangium TaxID=2621164 RepID=UPI003F5E6F93